MGAQGEDLALVAPWLAEDEVVLWVGRRQPRVWLQMLGRVATVAAVFGASYAIEVLRGRNVFGGGLETLAFVTFWLFVLGAAAGGMVPGVMLAAQGSRTRYVVTSRRAFQLIPIANRVLNRYVTLQPGMPVRVRFRWGDTARLEVGRGPTLRTQVGRLSRAADTALDVDLVAMQDCVDVDTGAAAARAAIAALG